MNARLYCPPQKLALTIGNLRNIIDDEIKDNYKVHKKHNTPIPLILLRGLKKTFPCN
jgi:hypothetical protein